MQKHMQTSKHKKNVERVEKMGIMKINHTARSSMFAQSTPTPTPTPINVSSMVSFKPSIPHQTYEGVSCPSDSHINVAYGMSHDTHVQSSPNKPILSISTIAASSSICVCGKIYKHKSSLCKHRKKCDTYIQSQEEYSEQEGEGEGEGEEEGEEDEDNSDEECDDVLYTVVADGTSTKPMSSTSTKSKSSASISTSMDITQINSLQMNTILATIVEQAKRNDELKNMLTEQSKQLMELSEKTLTNNVTNITTNNTVNNKFNLNLFLNTECKDAMNITDFIDSLPVNVAD